MLFAYPYRGDRLRIWGNVPFLTAGVILLRDPSSRDYHLHSGSNLLNELTNYGEFVLIGGNDLQHLMLACLMASDSHCVCHGYFILLGVRPVIFTGVNLLCPMREVTTSK